MASFESLLASILDGVPQAVWVADARGIVLFVNPAAVEAVGYADSSELKGLPSHETVHYKRLSGEPFPVSDCEIWRPRETGLPEHRDEDWLVRRDGSMFPVSWRSAPIDLEDGTGVVVVFNDITERRRVERTARERDAAEIRAAEARAAHRRLIETTTSVRRQVARDLHDGVQQRLFALLVGLQLAREEVSGEIAAQVDEAIAQAQAAIDDLRGLVAGLHPAILTTRGLVPAVESLATHAPLPVNVNADVPTRLPSPIEVNVYFFISEAITNAVKHAGASQVTVDMRADSNSLSVRISDDGVGGVRWEAAGRGLISLSDRVVALDGDFHLDSPPGKGTVVHGAIPLC